LLSFLEKVGYNFSHMYKLYARLRLVQQLGRLALHPTSRRSLSDISYYFL
jgi:hypothetical protein